MFPSLNCRFTPLMTELCVKYNRIENSSFKIVGFTLNLRGSKVRPLLWLPSCIINLLSVKSDSTSSTFRDLRDLGYIGKAFEWRTSYQGLDFSELTQIKSRFVGCALNAETHSLVKRHATQLWMACKSTPCG